MVPGLRAVAVLGLALSPGCGSGTSPADAVADTKADGMLTVDGAVDAPIQERDAEPDRPVVDAPSATDALAPSRDEGAVADASCGSTGQPCCADAGCAASSCCFRGACYAEGTTCGQTGAPIACKLGRCTCGHEGEPCCSSAASGLTVGNCDPGLGCNGPLALSGTCTRNCGGPKQNCCDTDPAGSATICVAGYVCGPVSALENRYCVPACTPGADQTCNLDPQISSLHGRCNPNGICTCNPGFELMDNRCK